MRLAVVIAMAACLFTFGANATSSSPDSRQRATLSAWLKQNPQFRAATRQDCNCDDDIKEVRRSGPWGQPIPDYEPYLLVGDFRKNGQSDLAVVLVKADVTNPADGVLMIFDGPFRRSGQPPAFTGRLNYVAHAALFLTQQGRNLIFGAFESEGCIFRPTHRTYVEDCGSD